MSVRVMWMLGVWGVLALGVAGCERTAQEPGDGAMRIAVLSPALGATLSQMGFSRLVVGRHAYYRALDRSIPVVGDETGVDAEALVRVRPTHVVIERASWERSAGLAAMCDRHGWEAVVLEVDSLDDIAASARRLREMIDPEDEASRYTIEAFERAMKPRTSAFHGRVLLLAEDDPPGALGPASFHGQVMERLGIANAITRQTRWAQLDGEDVLRLAPDAIVLVHPRVGGVPGEVSTKELLGRLGSIGGLDVPAVRAGRIGLIDDPLALMPSLGLTGFSEALEDLLASFGD